MRVFPSASQGRSLDREHIHAVLVFFAFLRQERCRREGTMDRFSHLFFPLNGGDVDVTVMSRFIFGKIGIPLPIGTQPLHVYLLDDHRVGTLETLSCRQDISIFSDIRTTGEDNIRC